MAEHGTVARPYAQAVFELAKAEGQLGPWSQFLQFAAELVLDPAVARRLSTPAADLGELAAAIADIAREQLGSPAILAEGARSKGGNFLRLLVENRRLEALPDIAVRYEALKAEAENQPGYSGMGTTLSANALALHAMRANLEQVVTPAAYDHMLPMSERLARGIEARIKQAGLPWHVSNVGARAEFVCAPRRPRNGTEAQAAMHPKLELAIHLHLLNRGFIIAPFHNMTLVSPATSADQVDRLVAAVGGCIGELLA